MKTGEGKQRISYKIGALKKIKYDNVIEGDWEWSSLSLVSRKAGG